MLLPWLVEALVRRLGGGGGVAWQLAVRRLQVESGAGARVVGGLVVAVAGAIALQSLFAGVERATSSAVQRGPARAGAVVGLPPGGAGARIAAGLGEAPGTRGARDRAASRGSSRRATRAPNPASRWSSAAATRCASSPGIGACRDGDAFVAAGGDPAVGAWRGRARACSSTACGGSAGGSRRRCAGCRCGRTRRARTRPAVLATPAAAGERVRRVTWSSSYVAFDPGVPDAIEHARNAVAAVDLTIPVGTLGGDTTPSELRTIRSWLLAGAVVVLVLIAAGLLIGMVEQLRERRRLLAALLAVGVRRRTLGGALLVQTAVPVVLGLGARDRARAALLAALLLQIAGEPVALDGWMIARADGRGRRRRRRRDSAERARAAPRHAA